MGEAFGRIKEVKIQEKEDEFLDLYPDPSKRYTRNQVL